MQIRKYSKTIGFITSVISWLYRTHCCCFVICFASVCKGNTIFRFLYQWRLPWRRVQQFTWFSAKTLICWATTSGLDTSRCWQTQAQTCHTHPEILADTLKLFTRHIKKRILIIEKWSSDSSSNCHHWLEMAAGKWGCVKVHRQMMGLKYLHYITCLQLYYYG